MFISDLNATRDKLHAALKEKGRLRGKKQRAAARRVIRVIDRTFFRLNQMTDEVRTQPPQNLSPVEQSARAELDAKIVGWNAESARTEEKKPLSTNKILAKAFSLIDWGVRTLKDAGESGQPYVEEIEPRLKVAKERFQQRMEAAKATSAAELGKSTDRKAV